MKHIYFLLSTAFFTITAQANANTEKGEQLFQQNCTLCHGEQGEKSALNQSAIINTLSKEEIITALTKRKNGEIVGAGNPVKSRLSSEDMQAIAEYLQILKK
ncbi:c-type cytochrome [Gallibacterium melopsittaci]|uniref:C-type cytochrome n=1 Tax=Gallibacterium melopsittaci TaxID=516063 RepID=A0ABV6HWD6_9PAST